MSLAGVFNDPQPQSLWRKPCVGVRIRPCGYGLRFAFSCLVVFTACRCASDVLIGGMRALVCGYVDVDKGRDSVLMCSLPSVTPSASRLILAVMASVLR